MCSVDILPDILEAGTSLKIEGRMKQPGYTAAVTGMYRKYLDILLSSDMTYQVNDRDSSIFWIYLAVEVPVRSYYKQHNGPSMMAFTNEKRQTEFRKIFLEKRTHFRYAGSLSECPAFSGTFMP